MESTSYILKIISSKSLKNQQFVEEQKVIKLKTY